MEKYEYPSIEGAKEVAENLGVDPNDILSHSQDWEYTYPELKDLPRYLKIYENGKISDLAKRVLGCFIFQALEGHLQAGGEPTKVRELLRMLFNDLSVHRKEFEYWSLRDDPHYDQHPEDAWYITPYVREFI